MLYIYTHRCSSPCFQLLWIRAEAESCLVTYCFSVEPFGRLPSCCPQPARSVRKLTAWQSHPRTSSGAEAVSALAAGMHSCHADPVACRASKVYSALHGKSANPRSKVTSWCSLYRLVSRALVGVSVMGQSLRVHSGEEAKSHKDKVWPVLKRGHRRKHPGRWLKRRLPGSAPGEQALGGCQEPAF